MRTKTFLSFSVAILLFTGCSMAPEMKTPEVQLPSLHVSDQNISLSWWKNFKDENLNALITEALKNNDDLKLAVANIQKARAQYGISEAVLYPEVDLDGSASRQSKSSNAYPSAFGGTYNNFGISASVAYELDFWGRAKNQKEADYSLLLASDADKEALKISLITDVATYYFNLVSLSRQIEIAEASLKSYDETLQYRKMQLKHGVVDALVVAQAKAQVAQAGTLVATLQRDKLTTQSALSLLVGRTPKEIFEKVVATSKTLPPSIEIPAGIPASLLQNRPDVKAAEETLRAKTALIGVIKAAYFPSISLTGNYGYQSENLDNLISKNSLAWGFGPSLNMPLFDFGRIKAAVDVSKADQKTAILSYEKTVKTAYKEVYDSLGSIRISKLKSDSVTEEVDAYREALLLATKKFDRGTITYLDVLDAQKGLLNAQLSSVAINAQLLIDEATLYKALGGGWNHQYQDKNQASSSN